MRIKLISCLVLALITIASAVSTQVQAQQNGCPLPTLASGNTTLPTSTSSPSTAITIGDKVALYISKCGTQESVYTFNGQKDDVFTILLKSFSGNNGNPCLTLLSPTGAVLGQGVADYSDEGHYGVAISYAYLPTSGSYKISVGPCNTNGEFVLQLVKTDIQHITFNTIIDAKFDPTQRSIAFRFDAHAKDEIYIKIDAPDASLVLQLSCQPAAACGNSDGNLAFNTNFTQILYNTPLQLPLTGEYLLIIRARSPLAGLTIAVDLLKPTLIHYGDTLDIKFSTEQSLQAYNFVGSAGDLLQMHVESNGDIDTMLAFFKDLTFVAADDDGGLNYDPEIPNWSLAENATYTVIVQPVQLGDQGHVKFNLSSTHIDLDEKPQEVILGAKQKYAVMSFAGKAGQHVSISARNISNSINTPQLNIIQNGISLVQTVQAGGEGSSVEFLVPQDGNVTVTVLTSNNTRSTFEVTLNHLD